MDEHKDERAAVAAHDGPHRLVPIRGNSAPAGYLRLE